MKKSQINLGNSTEILEFKFELKIFDDSEKVKENSIFSKYVASSTPQYFESNEPITSTSALWPVHS
jgi:hypothetical protein